MTATQAPTPGPLTSESVKLLVKGDLLRRIDGRISIHGLEYESGLSGTYLDGTTHANSPWSHFAFIGRPDADGWMPWSGGENPVPGQRVDLVVTDDVIENVLSDDWDWDCQPDPIKSFRLAPAAPVEASGSEGEAGGCAEPQVGRAVYERIEKLLKTDPTGWERSYLCHLVGSVEEVGGYDGPRLDDFPYRKTVAAFLKLRDESVGPGEADDEERMESADIILSLTTPARAEAQDEDTPCTDCGDTGVTHQTERRCSCQEAEAQDEGAEMTRLLKLADSALANVTAFEDDARYIMGNTNYAITENARSEIRSFLLAQSAKTSVRPKALEILERLLDHSGARGSFDAMKHGDAVKDAEELLRSARSPGHTDLMVTPESIDAYMRVNPMEAQDEGAAGELKPCPFCGGEAEIIHLDDGDNAGGSCVCCTKCQASGNVEFGRKENFVDNWNRRAHPSPTPAADADRVREVLEFYGNEDRWDAYDEDQRLAHFDRQTGADFDERGQKARDLLAALKSEGK